MTIYAFVYNNVTDRRTDRQTYRQKSYQYRCIILTRDKKINEKKLKKFRSGGYERKRYGNSGRQ